MSVTSTIVCLLTLVISAKSIPVIVTKSDVPSWHLPCGETIAMDSSVVDSVEEIVNDVLDRVKGQHQQTLDDYLHRDYEYLYESVRIGVHDHQYIPNWLPGKRDVNQIKRIANSGPFTITSHYPKLHSDLQKFAVAFEELVRDETNVRTSIALRSTQSYLTLLLCEVESSISEMPKLKLPHRIERNIMNEIERDPPDETRRLIRDWGVLLKYRDYLHAWRRVFDY